MEAEFLDDNKPKRHLKSGFRRTVSNFIDLIYFHLICQMLAKFSGLNPRGPHLSLEKEKQNFVLYSPTPQSGRVKLGSLMSRLCNKG